MKNFWLMIYKWFIVSITLQLVLLVYINERMLDSNSAIITSVQFEEGDAFVPNDKDDTIGIKIEKEAINVKFSYDLSYLAYMLEDDLIIRDSSGNRISRTIRKFDEESDKTLDMSSGNITHFTWMEDRNIIVYASSVEGENTDEVEVRTIDFELDDEHTYVNRIRGLQKGSKIRWIEVTYLTNMLYSQVLTKTNERLYSYDIMGNLSFVRTVPKGSKIRNTRYYDAIFIDVNNGDIQIYDGLKKTTKTINLGGHLVLLDVDRNDRAYVGIVDGDGKIDKIKIGQTQRAQIQEWETIELDESVKKEQINIDFEGNIYLNDMMKSKLTQIGVEGGQLKYEGNIIELRQDYFITRDEAFLFFNVFPED